jgi:hypothetical protein
MATLPFQQIRRINWTIGFLFLFLIGLPEVGSTADGLVVKLTTKAGTEVTVPAARFYTDDGLLDLSIAKFSSSFDVLECVTLEVAKGVHQAIPVGIFKESELKGGTHVVTLAGGEQLQGKLVGYVKADKSETNHVLSTAKRLVVASVPYWETDEAERMKSFQPKEVWQLEVKQPIIVTYAVIGPAFNFTYHPESSPSETHFASNQRKFGIRKDGQVTPLSWDDVVEMSLSPAPGQGTSVNANVALKLKSGSDANGSVVSWKEDGKETATRWILAATLRGSGITIMLSNPSCRLSRVQ